jgi:predicted secreted protein
MRSSLLPLRVACVLAIGAPCVLVACSTPPSIRHEPPRESVADFSAPRGSTYTAELPFNAGTGYAWTATSFDGKVVRPAGQSSRRASGEAMPGGPMIEEIRFDLVGKGETIIVFELKRPWEKDVSAVDTRSVKVTVK